MLKQNEDIEAWGCRLRFSLETDSDVYYEYPLEYTVEVDFIILQK